MDPKVAKQVKINLGAVKRIAKEVNAYQKELDESQEKINTTEFAHDTFEYKNLVNIRDENQAALDDSKRRLNDFKAKLQKALNDATEENDDVIEAKNLLATL